MIYDFLSESFDDDKLEVKETDIYTGHGSAYEVTLGRCEEILPDMADDSIDAIIVDPPYGVNMDVWDKDLPTIEVWNCCNRILKPGGHIAIFCQPSMVGELMFRMRKTEFDYRDQFIWVYQGTHLKGVQTEDEAFGSKIRNVYNPILIYRKKLIGSEIANWQVYRTNLLNLEDTRQKYKGDHSSIVRKFEETGEKHKQSETKSNTYSNLDRKGWVPNARGSIASNVQYCPRASKAEKTIDGQIENSHVSVKPLGIMTWLVRLLTNSPNQVVLDTHMGTGSTGVACRYVNRRFIGIDKDPEFIGISKLRIKYAFDLDHKYFEKIRPV